VVFKHRPHLVKGCILVAERCVGISPPNFAQDPLPRFASTIPVVLAVFVRFLQKQNANREPEQDHGRAEEIGKQVRVGFENGLFENCRPRSGRASENTAKETADNGPAKKRSAAYQTPCSGGTYPRHQIKGMME
jgi:hypothetical protein